MYITGEYNFYIILLSIIILITAAYISFIIISKFSAASQKHKLFWLFTGSITMGIGIWSFHFIGMLAFQIDLAITYHVGLTFLSAATVIIGSFCAFYLIIILVEKVEKIIIKTGIDAEDLELEITETIVLHDIDEVSRQLTELRDLGVRVSMDDFGVGYSSTGLLDRIPLDTIKLDRLFTLDILRPSKQAIIRAIFIMAETLELDVIAEGIETEEQLEKFSELGCYIVQGYYFYEPLPVERINDCLQENEEQLKKGGVINSL